MALNQQNPAQPDLNLLQAIDMVAKDKGIDKTRLIKTVEEAILKAAQSAFGPTRELEARFNEDSGQVDLFQYMTVVEDVADEDREIAVEDAQRLGLEAELGEELGFQIFWHPSDAKKAAEQDKEFGDLLNVKQARTAFGRIAAQTAKQVLIQRVRDEERDLIFNEYKDRKGELIKGVVRRFEKGNNIIVDLGRTEGILPFREQTPRETYRPGDRIVAYVKDIDREARGPQVILSRSDPKLVEKLFEAEVPEIYEGIVRIVACAREPGARSKIAVTSRDADVDPVGACVGMKGSRVQAVVQELRGEKIDIVPYDRDPARFVCAAIQPAEVNKVIVDEADGRMELVVPDEKLSLAIGRKGQNVRLAHHLTGWRLDIISESKFKQMEEEAISALQQLDMVTEPVARSMYRLGFRALEELAEATEQELAAIPGIGGEEGATKVREAAEQTMERLRQGRISAALSRTEPLSERERFLFVRGVGERTAQLLEEAGYRHVEDVNKEEEDKLAIKTGLGIKKARAIKQGAEQFLQNEWKVIDSARKEAVKAAQDSKTVVAPASKATL
ncbi:transcription termination factor NusA [Pendulispora brunnea]|uniref:Transcription termination/antitermination protein NusA n=1 Tax=Pendulispora brunnea TaxID=2905690 RepID=A0ABZ2JZK7_9BACT